VLLELKKLAAHVRETTGRHEALIADLEQRRRDQQAS